MAAALLAGFGPAVAAAAPGDPIRPVDRLSVDQTSQTASIASPGGNASLTTTMQATTINPVVDIVFVLDTTGSMSSKIATMAQGLSQFAQNLAQAGGKDLAFGIYVFGDLDVSACTATPDKQRWELPLTPLGGSTTVTTVANRLSTVPVNNGCDTPEDSIWAGFTVSATTPWRVGAQREVIVVTDAPGKENRGNVNGQASTLANWKAYATANNIHVTIVPAPTSAGINYADPGSKSQADMAAAFGSDATAVLGTAAAYVSYLTDQIVFKNNTPSFKITPKLTVTYADGTVSTDVVATATPSVVTTVGTSAVAFTLNVTAVAMAAIAKPGATTTAYLEFVEQGTGSIVARQTVTFTAANEQTVNVVFVDDDNEGSTVSPAAGFVAVYTGMPGTSVGFTEAMAQAGVPAGYTYVSVDNVAVYDNDDAVDQTITVHVKHGLSNDTVTSTRTITYVGAGASTPVAVTQTVTWSTVTDAVSHVTTYTAGAVSYPAVTSPVVAGYTADTLVVPVLPVDSPVTVAPASTSVTVTYTPNTQVVNVVFVDNDASGATVTPVSGFVARLTGPSGSAVGFTQAMAQAGVPSGYVFVSVDNVVAYDFVDGVDQTITVHVQHGLSNGTVTSTRTITYVGAGSFTPATVTQTVTWSTVTDAVSHVTTYTAGAVSYPAVTSPVVAGYTADTLVVPVLPVDSPVTVAPASTSVTVTYTPNTQVVNVVFVDDDASGATVTPVSGFVARLTGPSGSAVGFTQAMAQAGVPSGYVFASLDNVVAYDFVDGVNQTITVHLVHGLTHDSVTSKRTITYVGAETFTPAAVTQSLTWDTVRDEVTLVTTYTARETGFPAVISPVVEGYTADTLIVPALPVSSPVTVAPASVSVTVTYTPNTQVVNVVFVDDDASGAGVTPVAGFVAILTGPSGSAVGFTQAMAEAGIPAGFGFVSLVNVDRYDYVDAADQMITVHLNHGLHDDVLSTSRTIHYVGAGASTPVAVTQTVTWTTVTDLVTQVVTYTAGAVSYPVVTSPVVAGYTADTLVVPVLPVDSPVTVAPTPVEVTVTYTPNTQVVDVVLVDDDASGVPVTPVEGFVARLTGPSGSPVGFTQAMGEAGVPAGYVFVSLDNVVAYDFADGVDQTITVHVKHGLSTGSVTSTRTITYVGAAAFTPAAVTQTVSWGTVTDAVTHVTTYTAGTAGYAALISPVVAGYTADALLVPALPVVSPVTVAPTPVSVTVTYTPNTQGVSVVFLDDDAAGVPVTPVAGFVAWLTGPSGGAVGFTQAMAEAGVPEAYVFVSLDPVATYDLDDAADQVITVHLAHRIITTTLPVTRTIHYVGAGKVTPPDEVQTVDWVVSLDAVTRVATYTTEAPGYPAVVVPVLAGYTVGMSTVDALAVAAQTDVMPTSTVTTVPYSPIIIATGGTSTPAGPWVPAALLLLGAGVALAKKPWTC